MRNAIQEAEHGSLETPYERHITAPACQKTFRSKLQLSHLLGAQLSAHLIGDAYVRAILTYPQGESVNCLPRLFVSSW